MMDSVRRYLVKYPNARTSSLTYLAKRDETTKQLQRSLPWWKRLKLFLRGVR